MGNCTLTEPNGNLQLIAALQKLLCLIYLCFKVVGIDCRKHPDFLDGNHFLILFCFLFPLLLFKAILAVVHNPADRRGCLRGDFYQVQILFIRKFLCISCGHRSKLCPVLINDQDFSIPDFFIDLQLLFADSQHLQTYYFQTKIKCVLFKKSTHHSTSFPPISAPILTNQNETGNIDRFDNSQTVRTMMLCFVFSKYYNRVPKRCQAFRFKFYRNFTSYAAFLWLFLSVFSFFLILD